MFRVRDAPNYSPAKIALIIQLGVAIGLCLVLRFVVIGENKNRDKRQIMETGGCRDAMFLDITDIENDDFRYEF